VQFTRRLFRFLIQQALVFFHNVVPEIGHSHLPAHHSLKISVELLSLAQIHDIVYGLGGQVVFDSFFTLNLRFFMAGLKLGMALEETGQRAADFVGDLGQVVARLL